jgi:hypothetical protein
VVRDDADAELADSASDVAAASIRLTRSCKLRRRAGKEQVLVALIELEAMPAVLQVAPLYPFGSRAIPTCLR